MTVETILRRIAKECRENVAAFEHWQSKRGKCGAGEARGTVATAKETLDTIRQIRREIRLSPGRTGAALSGKRHAATHPEQTESRDSRREHQMDP